MRFGVVGLCGRSRSGRFDAVHEPRQSPCGILSRLPAFLKQVAHCREEAVVVCKVAQARPRQLGHEGDQIGQCVQRPPVSALEVDVG